MQILGAGIFSVPRVADCLCFLIFSSSMSAAVTDCLLSSHYVYICNCLFS